MSAQSFSIGDGGFTISGTVAPGQSTVDVTLFANGMQVGTGVCTDDGRGDLTLSTLPPTPAARAVISPDLLSQVFLFTSSLAHSTAPPYAASMTVEGQTIPVPAGAIFSDGLGF